MTPDAPPRAFLLAAGLATRARPLSDFRPKVLFPIAGVTALHLHVAALRAAGVGRIGINLHHHADQVEPIVEPMRSRGAALEVFREPSLLGTGGGLVNARSFLDGGPILVRNADVLLGADLRGLLRAHAEGRRIGALATLLLSSHAPLADFGGFAIDGRGRVVGHVPRAAGAGFPGRAFVYASAAVVEPRLLDRLERAGPTPDLIRDGILPAIRDGERVGSIVSGRLFGHIGSPTDYLQTVIAVLGRGIPPAVLADARRLAGSEEIGTVRRGRWISPRASVEAGARLGARVAIEAGARIPGSAFVDRSIVWEGVSLGAGERLRGAVACAPRVVWSESGSATSEPPALRGPAGSHLRRSTRGTSGTPPSNPPG